MVLNSAQRAVFKRLALGFGLALGVTLVWASFFGYAHAAPLITCNRCGCSDWHKGHGARQFSARRHVDANGNEAVVGGRPRGCPHAFCGCEASLYVFHRIIPKLNVARNWRVLFPRAHPAPGMAAVRTHHVFILMSHVSGDRWMAHDGNSGNGLTREHVVSITGYTIVDPDRSRMAMAEK